MCIRRKRCYGVEFLRTIRFAWDFTLSDQAFFPPFDLGPEWAWSWLSTGTGCPEAVESSEDLQKPFQRSAKAAWIWSRPPALGVPAGAGRGWAGWIQRSLPTSTFVWPEPTYQWWHDEFFCGWCTEWDNVKLLQECLCSSHEDPLACTKCATKVGPLETLQLTSFTHNPRQKPWIKKKTLKSPWCFYLLVYLEAGSVLPVIKDCLCLN